MGADEPVGGVAEGVMIMALEHDGERRIDVNEVKEAHETHTEAEVL